MVFGNRKFLKFLKIAKYSDVAKMVIFVKNICKFVRKKIENFRKSSKI